MRSHILDKYRFDVPLITFSSVARRIEPPYRCGMPPTEPFPMVAEQGIRDRLVSRSLDASRARAQDRVQGFLDAAWELMRERPNGDFTVQDVVERSGQSLRSFYHYFGGKQQLMVALLEESMRRIASDMRVQADGLDKPMDRLRASLWALYQAGVPAPDCRREPLAACYFDMLISDPPMAGSLQAPIVKALLADMAELGLAPEEVERTASILVQMVQGMAHRQAVLVGAGHPPISPEELWHFCAAGLLPQVTESRRARVRAAGPSQPGKVA